MIQRSTEPQVSPEPNNNSAAVAQLQTQCHALLAQIQHLTSSSHAQHASVLQQAKSSLDQYLSSSSVSQS